MNYLFQASHCTLQKRSLEKINNSSSFGDAVRGVAGIIFSKEELVTRSVRGRHTNKSSDPRDGLDSPKLAWLISKLILSHTSV